MYACICIYMYANTHKYTHAHAHTHTQLHIQTDLCITLGGRGHRRHPHQVVWTPAMHVRRYVCVTIHIYVEIYTIHIVMSPSSVCHVNPCNACMYVGMCVYIHKYMYTCMCAWYTVDILIKSCEPLRCTDVCTNVKLCLYTYTRLRKWPSTCSLKRVNPCYEIHITYICT